MRPFWGGPRYGQRGSGAVYIAMIVVAVCGTEGMDWLAHALRFRTGTWASVVTVGVLLCIGAAWSIRVCRVRSRVRAAGGCLCTECGYSLAGLSERGKCPECGVPYVMDEVRAAWAGWK